MIRKISLLFKVEILGVFVNALAADDKYPVRDCEKFQFPFQMQLSEKRKTFSEFFVTFMESASNFKRFRRKDGRDS